MPPTPRTRRAPRSEFSLETASKSALRAWAADPSRTPDELAAAADRYPEVDRAIAANPSAPPALLTRLATSTDRSTRARVAANPSTPADVHRALAAECPGEFLSNPALEARLRESPAYLSHLANELLLRLVKRPECPPGVLAWAAEHRDEHVLRAVASHPATPPEVRAKLRVHPDPRVRALVPDPFDEAELGDPEAAFRQAFQRRLASIAPRDAEAAWEAGILGLPQIPFLSREAQLSLSVVVGFSRVRLASLDEDVRAALVNNPRTPADALDAIASRPENHALVRAIAHHPNASDALRETLATSDSIPKRAIAATVPTLAPHLLARLARDPHPSVRRAVALHPAIDPTTLSALAQDEDPEVRLALSARPDAPSPPDPERLAYIASHATHGSGAPISWDAAHELARYAHTPPAILHALARLPYAAIGELIAAHPRAAPRTLTQLAHHGDARVRGEVAANPNTPVEALEVLSRARDDAMRARIAKHPNAPEHLRATLGRSGDDGELSRPRAPTAWTLWQHSDPSPEDLALLAQDPRESVRAQVAGHPRTPPELLAELAVEQRVERWLRAAVAAAPASVRDAVARGDAMHLPLRDPNQTVLSQHPLAALIALATTPWILADRIQRVAGSPDWLVRAAAARNEGTPEERVEKLLADPHPLVRALARARMDGMAARRAVPTPPRTIDTLRVTRALGEVLRTKVPSLRTLAEDPRAPAELLALLAEDPAEWVRASVQANPNAPHALRMELATRARPATHVETLAALARDRAPSVRVGAVDIEALAEEDLTHLATDPDDSVRRALARDPRTPPALLRILAKDHEESVQRAVVERTSVPPVALQTLGANPNSSIRWNVAGHAMAPATILEALARDPEVQVREAVAGNPATPPAILERLSTDPQERVRERVAENPHVPETLLARYALDPRDPAAIARRRAVARSKTTPAATLAELASDPDHRVRCDVARHPNTPVDVLTALAANPALGVAAALASNPNTPTDVIDGLGPMDDPALCRASLHNPRARPERLTPLFAERDHWADLARHPATPLAMLDTLRRRGDDTVRRVLTHNPSLSGQLLERLTLEPDLEVRRRLWKLPDLPLDPSFFAEATRILRGAPEDALPEDRLPRWLALAADLPVEPTSRDLARVGRDAQGIVRLCAALHPRSADATIRALCEDEDPDVATAARATRDARARTKPR
jgi:hypothetical protein